VCVWRECASIIVNGNVHDCATSADVWPAISNKHALCELLVNSVRCRQEFATACTTCVSTCSNAHCSTHISVNVGSSLVRV
jgi:hypothetical protein